MAKRKKKDPGFEELLGEAEEIVEKLESGEVSLEEALELYEKGAADLRRCSELLDAARTRVEQLLEESGETVPFEGDDLDEEFDDEEDEA